MQMIMRRIVILGGTALTIAALIAVIVLHSSFQPLNTPDVPVAASSVELRVKAVERKAEPMAQAAVADASAAVAIVCGADEASAVRYEARSAALRSIARRRDLPRSDVDALSGYLRSSDDNMREERVAALKNDVMNLLRNQEPQPDGFVETLAGMFESGDHPPAVLDYCIQHLGAMLCEFDDAMRSRVRDVLSMAAKRTNMPYAGTALYSLAEDSRATNAQNAELKRLTLALCKSGVNAAARIAAIQLAGELGYTEALPVLHDTLSGVRRDAVLDIVCIGSIGLIGNEHDLPLLDRFAADSRRAPAVNAAIERINKRKAGQDVSK